MSHSLRLFPDGNSSTSPPRTVDEFTDSKFASGDLIVSRSTFRMHGLGIVVPNPLFGHDVTHEAPARLFFGIPDFNGPGQSAHRFWALSIQHFRLNPYWTLTWAEERSLEERLMEWPAARWGAPQRIAALLVRLGRLPLQRVETLRPATLLKQLLKLGVYEERPTLSIQLYTMLRMTPI